MKISTYKIACVVGTAYAMYQDGWLTMLISEMKIDDDHLDFPCREIDLIGNTFFTNAELKPKTVADKVALFCLKYKQHKGQPYRARKEEKANMKLVTVTEQLLDTYFANVNYPLNPAKSMVDYVYHYNAIRDIAANGKPVRSFPDVYDREYEKIIGDDVSKLQAYWAHLRAQGWSKKDGVWLRK